jgi:AGZA family xanthine/uracil permease-like MFS transporter
MKEAARSSDIFTILEEQVPEEGESREDLAESSSSSSSDDDDVGCYSYNNLLQELSDFSTSILSLTSGDISSLAQLFFDNLSTILAVLYAAQGLVRFGDVSVDAMNTVLLGKVLPGLGISLFLGNTYYSWMASRLNKQWRRPYTAQPYGINTPAAFAMVFNVMCEFRFFSQQDHTEMFILDYFVYLIILRFSLSYCYINSSLFTADPVFFAQRAQENTTPDEAFYTAYKATLAANFVVGLISCLLGIFGPFVLRSVPPAALLVPIAGITISFLGLEQLTNSIAAPIVGFNAIFWVYLGWYAGIRVSFRNWRLPEALQVILVGVSLGWATGLNDPNDVQQAAKLVRWIGPTWTGGEVFAEFQLVKEFLGLIIPLGIMAPTLTLMCLVSAKEAGDPYPVRETLIVDGLGTMISSFFGSPFGTVVYIGHPAFKRSGAQVGYSFFNGILYLIFSWFGILGLLQSIVNQATIGKFVRRWNGMAQLLIIRWHRGF